MTDPFERRKAEAALWFRSLRDQIVAAFEGLEDKYAKENPGRFEVTPTTRSDGGGGIMSVLRGGGVFEKVGVNWSEVHGVLGERAQKAMAARGVPGMADDPRFWASGISLVAHMQNPHAPRGAHEHADVLDSGGLVVWGWVGPEPLHRICRGHGAFP